MISCLYEGYVHHRRRTPVPHAFRNRLVLFYIDLSELDRLPRWIGSEGRWAPFRLLRSDHLGGSKATLEESVRMLVTERTGRTPTGPIRLLTMLRYLGYCFNPVSFFYVFEPGGQKVETIVAEVNNTPWGERHCYVVAGNDDERNGGVHERFGKDFHVSPFMPMDLEYDWSFSVPGDDLAAHFVSVSNGKRVFDATLSLTKRRMSTKTLVAALVRFPLMTHRITIAIYWHAFRLWLKKAPFFSHPKHLVASQSTGRDEEAA